MGNFFRKLINIPKILKSYFKNDESLFLTILEDEVNEILEKYKKLGTANTEGLEDLLFHIRSYIEIPESSKETCFKNMDNIEIEIDNDYVRVKGPKGKLPSKDELEDYVNYLLDVEEQRAVEREFIFDHLKKVPFLFSL